MIRQEKNTITLDKLIKGETGKISRILGSGKKRIRLAEMGLTPSTSVLIKRIAPLGDPIEISFRGYALSLRKDDARLIEITYE